MTEVPSFWRTETYHALSVHFPVAMLLFAAAAGIFYFLFIRKRVASHFRFMMSFLLFVGLIAFWVSFYTGRNAYTAVVRTICDPFVLKSHLYWAYVCGYLFSSVAVLNIFYYLISNKRIKRILDIFIITLLIPGAICLSYAGHLGANVVYQQSGGVYMPSEDCTGFGE